MKTIVITESHIDKIEACIDGIVRHAEKLARDLHTMREEARYESEEDGYYRRGGSYRLGGEEHPHERRHDDEMDRDMYRRGGRMSYGR